MLSRTQRQLRAVEEKMGEHAKAAQTIIDKASEENRDRTDDEKSEIGEHHAALATLDKNRKELEAEASVEQEIEKRGLEIGVEDPKQQQNGQPQVSVGKSIGDQFVESKQFKAAMESPQRGKGWGTGSVEIQSKAVLTEGDNWFAPGGTPGDAGALVPLDVRPGIQPILFERLTVAQLFMQATTASNSVANVVETVATNNAGVVPEGTEKPESALEYAIEQVPVKKIATYLAVADEALEDAGVLRGLINGRLTLFVQQEEEAQVLHGAGGGNFLGLLPQVAAENQYVTSDAVSAQAADHIFAALTAARRSFLEPDGIIVNPDDWASLRLLKDGNDNYIAGSPFSTGPGEPVERLWGKRVVVTEAMFAGAALVGAFGAGATLYRKGGLTVEATNSHEDFFRLNLTAIRAEQREALAVHRPEAFAIADIGYAS
jgi:HK97 family phage major capsid protein